MGRTHGDDTAESSTAGGDSEPLEDVFDRLTDPVFALDREGRFTYVNDPAERVLGASEAELLDTVAWELFSGSRRAQFEQHCAEALRTQESTSFEEFDPTVETWFDVQIHQSEGSATSGVNTDLDIDLTDRQRAAVEAAYFSGFFEWPRDSSGEEVAESLDITSPTFHQHVRAAENKVFTALFDG